MMCFYCLNCCTYVMRHMNRIFSHELNPLLSKYKAGALHVNHNIHWYVIMNTPV